MKKHIFCTIVILAFVLSSCGQYGVSEDETSFSAPNTSEDGSTEDTTEGTTEAQPESSQAETTEAIADFSVNSRQDYLALYGESEIDAEWICCGPLDDTLYVDCGNRIEIYVDGYATGVLTQTEWIDSASQGDTDLLMQFSRGGSGWGYSRGETKTQTDREGQQFVCTYYDVTNIPFTYGDTEWLVEEGVFSSIDAALEKEYYRGDIVFMYLPDSEYVYLLEMNRFFTGNDWVEQYTKTISWGESAFTDSLRSEPPAEVFQEKSERIYEYTNADRICFEIVVDDLIYQVPDGLVAVQEEDDCWGLYYHHYSGQYRCGEMISHTGVGDAEAFLENMVSDYNAELLVKDKEIWKYCDRFIGSSLSETALEIVLLR